MPSKVDSFWVTLTRIKKNRTISLNALAMRVKYACAKVDTCVAIKGQLAENCLYQLSCLAGPMPLTLDFF